MTRERGENGYVLFDTLIGIAIAAIALTFAVSAMRGVARVREHVSQDISIMRDIARTLQVLRQTAEHAAPILPIRSGSRLAESLADGVAIHSRMPAYANDFSPRARIFMFASLGEGRGRLTMSVEGMGFRSSTLAIGNGIRLTMDLVAPRSPVHGTSLVFEGGVIGGSLSPIAGIVIPVPFFARAICIAAPFEAECRP